MPRTGLIYRSIAGKETRYRYNDNTWPSSTAGLTRDKLRQGRIGVEAVEVACGDSVRTCLVAYPCCQQYY